MAPLEIPVWLLELHPPNRTGLLEHLISRVDEEIFRFVAAADYGCDFEEHWAGLYQIYERRDVPDHLGFDPPREVLQLCRWSELDHQESASLRNDEDFHVMRAFVCATLLLVNTEGSIAAGNDSDESAIIQLIESVAFLGEPAIGLAKQFFIWRLMHERQDDKEYFARGLLILILLHGASTLEQGRAESLSEYTLSVDLLDSHFGQLHDKWSRMLKQAASLYESKTLRFIAAQVDAHL